MTLASASLREIPASPPVALVDVENGVAARPAGTRLCPLRQVFVADVVDIRFLWPVSEERR